MHICKRAMSLFLVVFMTACIAGCGAEKKTVMTAAKFISGSPTAPGDVFKFEQTDVEESAPIIVGATRQAGPNDSIIVTGSGFSAPSLKAYIYTQSTDDNGKANEAAFTVVDDNEIAITVDESLAYGVYAIYVEVNGKKSNIWLVNDPKIWWIGFTEVTYGDTVNIYGENLTSDNGDKSYVYLTCDDGYYSAEVVYADPYKVTFSVPYGLKDNTEYEVILHNGHGGEQCFVKAEQNLIYRDKKTTDFEDGAVIDVTEYGASPDDDDADDSIAIQAAVNAAKEGDTIYFPAGTYRFDNSVKSLVSIHFKGESVDNTFLIMGDNVVDGMFDVNVGPCEFSGLNFEYVIGGGKLTSLFIRYKGDSFSTEYYNLFIHNCKFVQATSASAKSCSPAIEAGNVCGIWIIHNDFMVTQMIFANRCEKMIVEENTCYGTCYVGGYYNQNFFLIWNALGMDVSNNYMASGDVIDDMTGLLDTGDYTLGRAFAIQGKCYDSYIANNTIDTAGLPNDNAGEQIMFEHVEVLYEGEVASASGNTLIMPDSFTVQLAKDDIITVIDGTGATQVRNVVTTKGKEITVDEPWLIPLDGSSDIVINRAFRNIAIHNNTISGFKNYKDAYTATTAVQAYGGINNMFVTSNTFKDLFCGMCITTHYRYSDSPTRTNGIFWSVISDNTVQNTGVGILINLNMIPDTHNRENPPTLLFGLTTRKNNISYSMDYYAENLVGIGGLGISIGSRDRAYNNSAESKTWLGDWAWGNIIENNTIKNSEHTNIALWKHQSKTILRSNTVSGKDTNEYTLSANAEEPILVK